MAIVYPLSTPTNIGIANIIFSADNATAISQSPFTYAQQVVKHQGERWRASVSLPPMKAVDAEYWIAFLLSLRGQYGTFLLKDPNYSAPRGLALTTKKNLLTFTEQFDNAAWVKTGTTVSANTTVAPDGTLSADTATATNTDPNLTQFVSSTAITYTISVWLMGVGTSIGKRPALFLIRDAYAQALVSPTLNPLTSSWQKYTFTGSFSVAPTAQVQARIDFVDLSPVIGDAVNIWGAQLELGSTTTSYQSIYDVYGPYVNGAGQTGSSLSIDGASPNELGYLIAGDYIQLGSDGTSTLHKVLTNVDTNNLGQGTIELWPSIRTAPADNATITLANPSGKFRLSNNTASWEINNISSYGITFDCVEAI